MRRARRAAVLLSALMPLSVSAADGTWISTASGLWSDTNNWQDGTIADEGGSGNFNAIDLTGDITVTVDAPRSLAALNFSDTDPLTPGRWILSDGGNSANTLTLSDNLNIAQGTVSLAAAVSAAGLNISIGGTGNPAPMFSIDGGTFSAGALSTINGGAAAGQFVLNSGAAAFNAGLRTSNNDGATIRVNGGSFSASDVTIQRNGGTNNSTGVFTSGFIFVGGTGSINTISLGSNNSNGAMSIEGGDLTVFGQITLGRQTSSNRGGHLRVTGGNFTSTDSANGLVLVQQNGASTASQQSNASFLGGVSTIEKITLGFDGNAIGTARINVNGGQLFLGSGGIVRNSANVTPVVTLTSGILGAKDSWSSSVDMILGAGGNITIRAADASNSARNITLSGAISGSGNITKTGAGILTLDGTSTYTGSIAVNEGALVGTTGGIRGNIANATNVTFDQSSDGAYAGVISGAGSVTKTGSGAVTLSSPQTYTGATTVSGGILAINGAQATSGITVLNGAGIGLAGDAMVNALTLGAGPGDATTLRVNTGSGVNSLGVLTANALIANGVTTIDVGSVGLIPGVYPVLDYSGAIGGTGGGFGAFTLGTLPPRVMAQLVNNVAGTSIDLNIIGVDSPRWTGAVSGDWDIGTPDLSGGTQNWREISNGNVTVYLQSSTPGDQVVFDDSATGTTTVNITTTVSPALVTVNNSTRNYTFTGAGISGPGQLIKQGAGVLTLSNSGNDYAGGTTIEAGTIQLGTTNALPTTGNLTISGGGLDLGGNSQDLSGALVLQSGTIANGTVNKTGADYDLRGGTVSANLAGAAGVSKTTSGTLVFIGTPSYTGATTVAEGTLQLGDGVNNGSVPGNIANSATVAFNHDSDQTWSGNITGTAGSVVKDGMGALIVTGENQGNFIVNAGRVLAMGSTNNSRLARFGVLTINAGTVEVHGTNALGLGTGTNPPAVVLNAGGTLHGGSVADTALYGLTLNGGTLSGEFDSNFTFRGDINVPAGATSNITAPNLSMANDPQFTVGEGSQLNISGALGGGSGLLKSGAGTLTLSGANTYTSGTTVGQGTLVLVGGAQSPVFNGAGVNILGGRLVLDYSGGASVASQVQAILDAGYDLDPKFSSGQIRTTNPFVEGRGLGWIDDTDADQVLVAYTYFGDADLDGDVDGIDVGAWAQNFTGELGGAGTSVWAQGDWDYDGDVDGIDVGLWAQNFTGELGGTGLSSVVVQVDDLGSPAAAILQGLGVTVVPEPGTTVMLAFGLTSLLSRGLQRRVRRH